MMHEESKSDNSTDSMTFFLQLVQIIKQDCLYLSMWKKLFFKKQERDNTKSESGSPYLCAGQWAGMREINVSYC